MSGYKYEALAPDGKVRRGVLESDSPRQARARLREQGMLPVEVAPIAVAKEAAPSGGGFLLRKGRLSASALALLTRQLATLLAAGLTVEQALNALIEQSEAQGERQLLAAVRGDVLAGQPLARALAHHPAAFPDVYITLVEAGERSGHLADVLARLADYTEERELLRGKVLLAFVYPALVTIVALVVVTGLLVYVVPQVVQVFQNTNQTLPLLTRALIGLSNFLRVYGGFVVLALAGAVLAVRAALAVPRLRERWHRWLLRLPLVAPLHRGLNTARLAATLAILVGSRVPLLVALRAGAGVVANVPMRRALDEAAARVQEGASLARALGSSKLFPPVLVHMIASGEASGRLGELLERAAAQQSRELDRRVAAFVTLLEPLLILAMGGIVLAIVLAILLPIFELNQIIR
ncbi:MAG TPA: type II secretion system inner membrane protein GspF [Steroidobacteraceae bacterium]|nr:type II secretion system inner membrane protein GspF [Steroidobacteraceae bacterium]